MRYLCFDEVQRKLPENCSVKDVQLMCLRGARDFKMMLHEVALNVTGVRLLRFPPQCCMFLNSFRDLLNQLRSTQDVQKPLMQHHLYAEIKRFGNKLTILRRVINLVRSRSPQRYTCNLPNVGSYDKLNDNFRPLQTLTRCGL